MPSDVLIDGMLALQRVLQYERRQKLLVTLISFIGSWGLASCAYWGRAETMGLFSVLAIAAFLVGLRLMRDIRRERDWRKAPVYRLLHEHPQLFVWIYPLQVQFMPAGIRLRERKILLLRLVNRDELQLRGSVEDINCIEAMLLQMLPHATFGYSPERDQWYAVDPYLLWRE